MTGKRTAAMGFAGLLMASPVATAHHGWGYYDTAKPLYLSGSITAVSWRNPHPGITIAVSSTQLPANWSKLPVPPELAELDFSATLDRVAAPEQAGSWTLDLAPINRLQSWGMPREPMVGDSIVAIAFPACTEKGVARPALIVIDGIGVRQQSVALPAGCSGRPRG